MDRDDGGRDGDELHVYVHHVYDEAGPEAGPPAEDLGPAYAGLWAWTCCWPVAFMLLACIGLAVTAVWLLLA